MVMQIWCQTLKNTVLLRLPLEYRGGGTGSARGTLVPRIIGPGSHSSIVYYVRVKPLDRAECPLKCFDHTPCLKYRRIE